MIADKKHFMSLMAIYALYAGLVCLGVFHHEPWFDEAQAWLLGRDSPAWDLINIYLRYEGSPGLWHFILGLAAKNGLPYGSMSIIGASFALLGVLIFLVYSPFPLVVKILFPFSYFILYQYAVVARSYVLLPSILFLLAALYPIRARRIYAYAFLLGLLANVSLHGLILAFSWTGLDLLSSWKNRHSLSQDFKRKLGMACVGLLLAGLFAAWQLRFPLDHSAVKPRPSYNFHFVLGITQKFLSNALTERRGLSNVIVMLSLWHLWKTRLTLSLFLVPALFLGHLFALVYASVWHEGTMFLLWIFCLWMTFGKTQASFERFPKHQIVTLAGLLTVLSVQLVWAFTAFRNDLKYSYSAAAGVAAYLKSRPLASQSIYATGFHSTAILPYFDHNIFSNWDQSHSLAFWDWSLKNEVPSNLDRIILDAPDTIIFGVKSRYPTKTPVIPGYVSQKFIGYIYWKNRILEEDSYVVYEKVNFFSRNDGGE